jgi:hypothetical protein
LHPNDKKVVAIVLTAIAVIALAVIIYTSPPPPTQTATLQPFDFHMTHTAGCLRNDTTGIHEYYSIDITNDLNERAQYVNATIGISYIDFVQDVPDISTGYRWYVIVAGPNQTTNWKFLIKFNMSGKDYGEKYENLTVKDSDFAVAIYYYRQDTGTNQLVFFTPDLIPSYSDPQC